MAVFPSRTSFFANEVTVTVVNLPTIRRGEILIIRDSTNNTTVTSEVLSVEYDRVYTTPFIALAEPSNGSSGLSSHTAALGRSSRLLM